MNSINKNDKVVRTAYESLSCSLTEVEAQGVLCASSSDDEGSLTGGLNLYTGSAL